MAEVLRSGPAGSAVEKAKDEWRSDGVYCLGIANLEVPSIDGVILGPRSVLRE